MEDMKAKKKELDNKADNTRRNKRMQKELDGWKAKIVDASGNVDFDKIT